MTNMFYQQFLTDKSFFLLTELKKQFKFTLIGGWAVYFYTNSLKSKDIDMIVDFSELEQLRKEFPIEKNERLKKYQIKIEEIDIDIYMPFYSDLGLPVEEIIKKTTLVNGFVLLEKEVLLITKLKAYQDRGASVKGQKDLIDIISLVLLEDFDFKYLSITYTISICIKEVNRFDCPSRGTIFLRLKMICCPSLGLL